MEQQLNEQFINLDQIHNVDRQQSADPCLFITSVTGVQNLQEVKRLGIDIICSVMSEELPVEWIQECQSKKIQHKQYSIDESDMNIWPVFQQILEVIRIAQQNRQKVLIHCLEGISPSAAIVLCVWLHFDTALTLQRALRELQQLRPLTEINETLMATLRTHYPDQIEPEKCALATCNTLFISGQKNWNKHSRCCSQICSDQLPRACIVCGKSFRRCDTVWSTVCSNECMNLHVKNNPLICPLFM